MEAMTCHASKGLQADYVILCDAVSSDLGFPSEVSDDPVLNMVINQVDHFPNEEERRLFYVALTRAKKEVHIITTYANPSIFIEEIKQYNNIDIIESGNRKKIKCPSCDSGEIVESQSGFLYCTNRPLCEYAPPRCPKCKKSQMTKVDNLYVCEGEGCNYSAASCPVCEDGYLIERTGKYGQFYGCSNFASTGCKGK
jgi:DNA helicase-4